MKRMACELKPFSFCLEGDTIAKVIRQVKPKGIDPKDEYYRVKLDKSGRIGTVHVNNILRFFER